jgi:hypothetical protein
MIKMVVEKKKLRLSSIEEYKESVLDYISFMLKKEFNNLKDINIQDIKDSEDKLNIYSNIDLLEPINKDKIIVLDDDLIDKCPAEKSIINGKIFWEHTAAGEATRLGLGTKYLLNLKRFSVEEIVEYMRKELVTELKKKNIENNVLSEKVNEIYEKISFSNIIDDIKVTPDKLLDLSLGSRHMLQLSFDIKKLADKYKTNYEDVLKKQRLLIVLNEATAEEIIDDFNKFNYFSFDSKNVYFMVQRAFHGICIKEGKMYFDTTTDLNKRLHNHGQMMMQKTHDNVIFNINEKDNKINRKYLSRDEFRKVLSLHDDLISYNIEDLEYLNHSLDLNSISLALSLKEEGYLMAMEIVSQNPIKPQKGGACFYDSKLKKTVMIESHQLKDLKPEDIKYLNKNFNHYINPVKSFDILKDNGLPITLTVKTMLNQEGEPADYIYPQPVQGDMNFLVKTAYIMRRNLKPISSWKSPATTPAAIKAMYRQDNQEGFKDYVKKFR